MGGSILETTSRIEQRCIQSVIVLCGKLSQNLPQTMKWFSCVVGVIKVSVLVKGTHQKLVGRLRQFNALSWATCIAKYNEVWQVIWFAILCLRYLYSIFISNLA